MGVRDALMAHLERPLRRQIDGVRNRLADLNALLASPAAVDQFPGRQAPFIFPRLYGPIALTAPRRFSGVGFEHLASVADPGSFILPRDGTLKVGRIGSFVWEATAFNVYVSWTWNADMNATLGVHTRAFSNGTADIFSSVIDSNGGALLANNNRYVDLGLSTVRNPDVINTSFEIGLYDRLRGRFLHDGDRLPQQMFSGQGICNRAVGEPIRFDPNTDIEPRLYVNEVAIRNLLSTDAIFNACLFQAYVSVSFIGHLEQTDPNAGGF